MNNITKDPTVIITSMMDNIKMSEFSLDQKYLPKDQYPTNLIPDNKRVPPLEGGYSKKNW